MIRKKYLYIFLFSLLIGLIHALIVYSINAFFTWALIGIWLDFTLKFLEKRRIAREVNSSQNSSFFLFGPLFIGLLYNFWGYYTAFLGENLLEGSIVYVSLWVLIFAYPYLFYSLYINYLCLSKFNVVYFGTKGFGARKFGLIITILWVIGGFLYLFIANIVSDYLTGRSYFDLVFVILIISSFILLVVYGVAGHRRSIPDITRDYIDQRRARARMLETARPTTMQPQPRPVATTSTTRRTTTRRTPRGTTTRTTTQTTSKSAHRTEAHPKTSKPKKTYSLNKLKPKAGRLTVDDFKCIFCFNLPELPKDQTRGIVICPHCKHPAHIDEFRDWTRNSNLCSRCDTALPANFIRNPEVIPVSVYLKGMDHLLKHKG